MTPDTRGRSRTRGRRVLLVGLTGFVALVVAALVGLRPWSVSGPVPGRSGPPRDRDVLVTDVSYTPTGSSFTVGSVAAVSRGDRAFLRLRLIWSDDDPDEARVVPAFSAEVTHREPHAGMTSVCGVPEPSTVSARSTPETIDLPCEGLLVPEDVAAVALRS